jgi:flagellar protein FliL
MAEAKDNAAPKSSKKRRFIIIGVAVVLLVGGAVGGTVLLMGGKEAKPATAEAGDAEHGDEEEVADEEHSEEGDAAAAPIYVALAPPFVVNFQDAKKRTRYIKAEISVLAKSAKAEEAVNQHIPAVRNSLVLLLSRQVYEDLLSNEGKEQLRADALAEVQAVLDKRAGKKSGKGVEDLFFSSFVMQ